MDLLINQAMRDQLFANLRTAHRRAADDTVAGIRAAQAHRTGRLAASYHAVENPWTPATKLSRIVIVSDAVYANAVEWGANARAKASVRSRTKRRRGTEGPVLNRATRRGPHMAGNHVVLEHGDDFLEHMGYRLYEASH